MRFIALLFLIPFALFALGERDLLMHNSEEAPLISVNNRILANVNGKLISVIDLMKRMDMVFLKQFPEYTDNPRARYQFYLANWKRTLSDLIDKELILADAKEAKMEVSNGDVRQEMEEIFGPNIIVNLDKIGLSMDEATKIVAGDIAIRRMMFMKVTSKAMGKVTPLAIRKHYDKWAEENSRPAHFKYRMLTVREKSLAKGAEIAADIYTALENVHATAFSEKLTPFKGQYNLSEPFSHTEKEISPQNLAVIVKLEPGQLSQPVKQKSRVDNSDVWRLFFLEEKTEGALPTLKEAEGPIREQLMDLAMNEEQKIYFTQLKKHFGVTQNTLQESFPKDFSPFTLK